MRVDFARKGSSPPFVLLLLSLCVYLPAKFARLNRINRIHAVAINYAILFAVLVPRVCICKQPLSGKVLRTPKNHCFSFIVWQWNGEAQTAFVQRSSHKFRIQKAYCTVIFTCAISPLDPFTYDLYGSKVVVSLVLVSHISSSYCNAICVGRQANKNSTHISRLLFSCVAFIKHQENASSPFTLYSRESIESWWLG